MLDITLTSATLNSLHSETHEWVEKVANQISNVLPAKVETIFDTDGVRDGEGENWEPTTHVARLARKSKNYSAPTLTDTEALRSSMRSNVEDIPDGYLIVLSSGVSYASAVQNGSTITIGKKTYSVPAREFLFFTKSDEDEIDQIIQDTKL